ncbi:MAG: ATP-binding protein, partial [Desulfotignum sp.]|jgi:signal transduction histidine kinase|nr:ATP-binding protein [Desulfotignum sp.]
VVLAVVVPVVAVVLAVVVPVVAEAVVEEANNMNRYPNWKSSIVIFTTLILLLLGNFFWQTRRITRTFKEHSLAHSNILAAVVELNIKNSLMSLEGMETIISSYLKNSAQFIHYLNEFDAFSGPELTAFAGESGLAGIRILSTGSSAVSGPTDWLPETWIDAVTGLHFLPDANLYIFRMIFVSDRFPSRESSIIVGMSAAETETIRRKMSVETLLDLLNRMDSIEYVRFIPRLTAGSAPLPGSRTRDVNARSEKSGGPLPAGEQSVSFQETILIHENGRPISETRITMADRVLIVGLEANYFFSRIKTLKKEMVVFVTILILFGGVSSLWLYRVQRHQLHQARQFERKMARQKEQAALGRAAATITHEIRNPLNAISMGLQRLQMETGDLAPDHLALIGGMREAVSRTNAIISNLQQYVRPFTCECQPVAAADLISTLLAPYRQTCSSRNIAIDLNLDSTLMWNVDRHLLGQAFDNFIKNAVEAQPDGGFLRIQTARNGKYGTICFENHCDTMDRDTEKMIFEPYFTTKTYGSGLGLAISRKIIEAHSGSITTVSREKTFSIHVSLPVASDSLSCKDAGRRS